MTKIDRSVVRNQAYRKSSISIRERHNERKNINYANSDIVAERSQLNVHFKSCAGTYEETFNKMLEESVISTRGLKDDAKVFEEFIFDVNSAYFERNGGYEYAKKFFEEAYRLAIKETGGEKYILSAVMHADERNKALSDELGYDVFHYHLHVVYVPVVQKEVKWTKRCKDPALVGTTKEIITQVSHSKKWASERAVDESGKPIFNEKGKAALISSYSLLQDRFFEYMQSAGFTDFERGVKGSTTQHLSDLDYKIQQDQKRINALDMILQDKDTSIQYKERLLQEKSNEADTLSNNIIMKEQNIQSLEKSVESKKKQLSALEQRITVSKKASLMFQELESMAKKALFGNKVELTLSDWDIVCQLAKEGISSRIKLSPLEDKIKSLMKDVKIYKERWEKIHEETSNYTKAMNIAPSKIKAFIDNIIQHGVKEQELGREKSIIAALRSGIDR